MTQDHNHATLTPNDRADIEQRVTNAAAHALGTDYDWQSATNSTSNSITVAITVTRHAKKTLNEHQTGAHTVTAGTAGPATVGSSVVQTTAGTLAPVSEATSGSVTNTTANSADAQPAQETSSDDKKTS